MTITDNWRRVLVGLAAIRLVLGAIAIPLAPVLYEDHFLWLVFLRPTKDVFLAAGFLARKGDTNLFLVYLAAIPLSILGVWLFYLIGRAYRKEIEDDDVPGIAGKIVRPDRVQKFEEALDKRGPKLILLGRLAVLSSSAVAAAAGAADLQPRKFFPMDLAGGLLSITYTVVAGYILGQAYEAAGPWITVVGVSAFIGFAYVLGRALKKA